MLPSQPSGQGPWPRTGQWVSAKRGPVPDKAIVLKSELAISNKKSFFFVKMSFRTFHLSKEIASPLVQSSYHFPRHLRRHLHPLRFSRQKSLQQNPSAASSPRFRCSKTSWRCLSDLGIRHINDHAACRGVVHTKQFIWREYRSVRYSRIIVSPAQWWCKNPLPCRNLRYRNS